TASIGDLQPKTHASNSKDYIQKLNIERLLEQQGNSYSSCQRTEYPQKRNLQAVPVQSTQVWFPESHPREPGS
ncbi:MAG: hypothetical protein OXG97_10085, partial [Candidatus Poribacteria bacterium]|nr:hypothetical protein [Candidatus Poribacteria bacterium]